MEELQLQSAIEDRGLTVTNLPEKGRCLFTTRDFYPGVSFSLTFVHRITRILTRDVMDASHPVTSRNARVVRLCGTVAALASKIEVSIARRNTGYIQILYNNFQKLDWKLHRLECHALSRLDKDRRKYVTPSIRLMLKLYLRRKLQSEKVIPTTATDNYDLVEALVARILFIVCFLGKDMSDIDEKQLVLYAQMSNLVNLILQWPEIELKEIAENFSKLACNAHTICDSELRPLGTGLYPVISIINHSCLPNAVLVFEGRLAVVRAMQHIAKGGEVRLSFLMA
ncbi:hypothetical protein JRO89_XS07G0166600 [Xanthoceras sorbifolium]|uniref:SET domain-containing protein n=1 Tax=Xanthoceras sorbifolium TaxID=99658 RepID=A0ABQ8HU03_9ROSI|nr:hypothetical protein JRO89_XS07G0166600 [Xanthoceras sorbifolium]